VLGAAVGVGALTAPAAAPAAVGLLASIPTLSFAGAGALATLILAFKGVGKAIGGDKKAFDELTTSQKAFVQTVRGLSGWLDRLKQIAAQSLFPGLTKGLRAALSPGTVNAIETALVQLGHALGSAGAAWGKYFGSARFQHIFGPLMQSAARNIGVLSDAMLHLFDALGCARPRGDPVHELGHQRHRQGRQVRRHLASRAGRDREARRRDARGADEPASRRRSRAGPAPRRRRAREGSLSGREGRGQGSHRRTERPVGVISRNQGAIREIVGGALNLLIGAVKVAAAGVRLFVGALHAIGGHKAAVIAAITAIGIAIALHARPRGGRDRRCDRRGRPDPQPLEDRQDVLHQPRPRDRERVQVAVVSVGAGRPQGRPAVVEPFSHLPGFLGHWARVAKDRMQNQLDRIHPPNMNWGGYAAGAGFATGIAWKKGFFSGIAGAIAGAIAAVTGTIGHLHVPKKPKSGPKPGTHAWYIKTLGYDPTQQSTFGKPPPFKSTGSGSGSGKPPVIPLTATHLLALASAQASMAQNAKSVKKEREHLEKEIADLEKADKILIAKWKHAHGKAKEALFRAITATENKIRAAKEEAP
jgi:hypothetical protein